MAAPEAAAGGPRDFQDLTAADFADMSPESLRLVVQIQTKMILPDLPNPGAMDGWAVRCRALVEGLANSRAPHLKDALLAAAAEHRRVRNWPRPTGRPVAAPSPNQQPAER